MTTDRTSSTPSDLRRLRPPTRSGWRSGLLLAVAVVLAVVGPLGLLRPAAAAERVAGSDVPREERLTYDWKLGGFAGTVAGIFLPSSGQGVMSVEPGTRGSLRTELTITSPSSNTGEYWRYGSRIDATSGHALEAWNSYRWRDKQEDETMEVEAEGVRDIVSGIYHIRRDLPPAPSRMRIWSDGKVYPVVVIPRGVENRKVDGTKISTLHYTVKGLDIPGEREWKGSLEIWLARDPAATPVEMHIRRSLANLRLEIQSLPEGA